MSQISQAMQQQANTQVQQQSQPMGVVDLVQGQFNEFAKVMPSQVDKVAWVRMAQSAINKNVEVKAAAERDPQSLMFALIDCARLGHTPGTDEFYLTVRSGKVQGSEGYKGMIQRILRSGQYSKVVAEAVFDSEMATFRFDPNVDDRPHHTIDYLARTKDTKPVMSYAYAVRTDGSTSKVAIADPRYLAKIRAQSRGKVHDAWDETMVLKSSIKQLINYVDTSTEDRRNVGAHVMNDAFQTATIMPPSNPMTIVTGELEQ